MRDTGEGALRFGQTSAHLRIHGDPILYGPRYVRMEDLVMAYTMLEQARSHEPETASVMRSLKTMIQVDGPWRTR